MYLPTYPALFKVGAEHRPGGTNYGIERLTPLIILPHVLALNTKVNCPNVPGTPRAKSSGSGAFHASSPYTPSRLGHYSGQTSFQRGTVRTNNRKTADILDGGMGLSWCNSATLLSFTRANQWLRTLLDVISLSPRTRAPLCVNATSIPVEDGRVEQGFLPVSDTEADQS